MCTTTLQKEEVEEQDMGCVTVRSGIRFRIRIRVRNRLDVRIRIRFRIRVQESGIGPLSAGLVRYQQYC